MLAVSESCQSCSRILALEEDKATGNWKERSVCMGDTKTCSFPGLINHHHKFIISFAEDESGNMFNLSQCLTLTLNSMTQVTARCFCFFKGNCILWPQHTPAPCLLLERFSNSWTPPGVVADIFSQLHGFLWCCIYNTVVLLYVSLNILYFYFSRYHTIPEWYLSIIWREDMFNFLQQCIFVIELHYITNIKPSRVNSSYIFMQIQCIKPCSVKLISSKLTCFAKSLIIYMHCSIWFGCMTFFLCNT